MRILLLLCCLTACASKAAPQPPRLSDPTKADDGGLQITPLGVLEYDGEVFGELGEDQLDAYTFNADEGAIVTLDNSHRGTAAALDSVLYVYGPSDENGFYGATPIASDDDSGWGAHARLRELALPAAGEYLAVLGLWKGATGGAYRLTLTCESGECATEPPSIVIDATPLRVGEDGSSQSFEVRITTPPSELVQIWIESDSLDEALVYPTRLFFCPEGQFRSGNTCTEEEPFRITESVEWSRTVTVRVTGVRDDLEDGDRDFSLRLRVETNDADYAAIELDSLEGVNEEGAEALDYSALDDLQDDELLMALQARIGDHDVFGYQGANSARTLLFGSVDVRDDGMIESIYNADVIEAPGESILAFMRGFNTEHGWPQGQFDRIDPMVSDLHHIFPCDIDSNGTRSSYGFGYTSNPEAVGSNLGSSSTDARPRVYQVRRERRGDTARAHFYMVARYTFDASLEINFDDDESSENGSMEDLEEAVLRQWNDEDPVDEWEQRRNNRIEALQGNRNPFVDRPDFVERIAAF
ncbi:MAG: deoxyribonuclease-1 [Polyangiales bacterium]